MFFFFEIKNDKKFIKESFIIIVIIFDGIIVGSMY